MKQNNLTKYEQSLYDSDMFRNVRVLINTEDKNDVLFVLKDVCDNLGLDSHDVIRRLDDGGDNIPLISQMLVNDALGRQQLANVVNEEGLYQVIFTSRKPQAKAFRHWVCGEVLPTIRRTGQYVDEERILELERANDKLVLENKEMSEYLKSITMDKRTINITQIAKDYGISAIKLNKLLNDFGVQYNQNDQWLLYAKYADKGYVTSDTYSYFDPDEECYKYKMRTVWTQRGRKFLYHFLKQHGILPTIEREELFNQK